MPAVASCGRLPQNPAPDTKSSALGSWRLPSQCFVRGISERSKRGKDSIYIEKKHLRLFSSFNPGWHSGKELPANVRDARDWVQSLVGKILWRRKGQPAPVFLPGESDGQRSLAGYDPWARKEWDKPELLSTHRHKLAGETLQSSSHI